MLTGLIKQVNKGLFNIAI